MVRFGTGVCRPCTSDDSGAVFVTPELQDPIVNHALPSV